MNAVILFPDIKLAHTMSFGMTVLAESTDTGDNLSSVDPPKGFKSNDRRSQNFVKFTELV